MPSIRSNLKTPSKIVRRAFLILLLLRDQL